MFLQLGSPFRIISYTVYMSLSAKRSLEQAWTSLGHAASESEVSQKTNCKWMLRVGWKVYGVALNDHGKSRWGMVMPLSFLSWLHWRRRSTSDHEFGIHKCFILSISLCHISLCMCQRIWIKLVATNSNISPLAALSLNIPCNATQGKVKGSGKGHSHSTTLTVTSDC